MCTSGLWVPFRPLQGDALDTPPSPRDPYLRAQPGRPAWPECLSSSPPSPHVRPHPGKTEPAGHSLAMRSVCSSEPRGAPTSSMCPRMDKSACQRGLRHQCHLGTCQKGKCWGPPQTCWVRDSGAEPHSLSKQLNSVPILVPSLVESL